MPAPIAKEWNPDHRCLAVIDYKTGEAIVAIRCQKDCRHGWGKKRPGYRYHRADYMIAPGVRLKMTWDGIGVMSPEMERERLEATNRRPNRDYADFDREALE